MTENFAKRRWPKVLAVVALVFIGLGVAAAFTLDRILTSLARDQAAALSKQWERPVEIGAVKTTFLTGLGVRVEGVRVGAASGEPRPLFELDRAEVKLALLEAITSGGKDVQIRSAELQGVRANVVKLKDGSTNVDRLSEAMARNAPPARPAEPEKPAATEAKPADLSRVRVEHAAVLDARIAFVDEGTGGKELYVDDLDVVVDGLAAGAPLEVVLKAGVLSATQNLELRVHAPPLPASLTPSPDRVSLKVQPIELTPLAPFAPREAGFRGGRFTADLDVALGAAVPGGAGPTTVRGGFAATALRFAGQEGGKALDVTLDADLSADAKQGDLSISKLLLTFGPAGLEGKGKVTALLSESPRIEGLRIVSRNLDLAALAPYYPPLTKLIGGTMAGPIGLTAQAAGTAERPVLELRADLTPVRMSFPKLLEKAAGGKLAFAARLRGGAAGALRFDAEGDMTGLDLRPGGSLAKKPGDRFTFTTAATRSVSGKTQRLELASFAMGLADMNVKARGTTELAPRSTRFDLGVEIDRVDVDKLLLPSPAEQEAPVAKAAKPGDAASTYAGLAGKASLRIGSVIAEKQTLSDVRVAVVLKEDEVTVEEGRFGLWGGVLSVAGTQARLAPADMPFKLVAKAERIAVEGALGAFTDKKVLTGRLDADVKLSGKGEDTDRILKALDGTIEGKLVDGVFHGKDLIGEVAEPIAKAIPALGARVTKGGTTKLGKVLPVSLRIQGGRALLQKPLEFEERGASFKVQGAFAFDGEVEMPTTLTLSPGAVADVTAGKAKVDEPLPFSFKLIGKAWSPRLAGLDVMPAVKIIATRLGTAALGKALGLQGTPKEAAQEKAAVVKEKAQEKAQDAAKSLEKSAAKKLKGLFR
ncbi:MAG TPA: AsmA family protein [Anaeromyxobacteraceae bacterium]|nr:AsmA family protein [Anaeromyxobacteraceae bacterium]